jgi:hypothetical protein
LVVRLTCGAGCRSEEDAHELTVKISVQGCVEFGVEPARTTGRVVIHKGQLPEWSLQRLAARIELQPREEL